MRIYKSSHVCISKSDQDAGHCLVIINAVVKYSPVNIRNALYAAGNSNTHAMR